MADSRNINKGALFASRNKNSDRSPDYTGHITCGQDMIKYLVDAYNSGTEPKLRLLGYINDSPKAGKYLGLIVTIDQDQQSRPAPQQSSGLPGLGRPSAPQQQNPQQNWGNQEPDDDIPF